MEAITPITESESVEANESPGLVPVSDRERLSLMEGLERAMDRHPRIAADPLVVMLVRLLLATGGNAGEEARLQTLLTRLEDATETAKLERKHAEANVESLRGERGTLDNQMAALQAENGGLAADNAKLKEENIRLRGEQSKGNAGLQKRLDDAEKALAAVRNVLTNPKANERHPVAAQVQKLLKNHATVTGQYGQAITDIEGLNETAAEHDSLVAKYNEERENLLKRIAKIIKAVKGLEFAGQSSRYNYGNKPAPCCPVCVGIDPSINSQHRAAGHTKQCWFGSLVKRIQKL